MCCQGCSEEPSASELYCWEPEAGAKAPAWRRLTPLAPAACWDPMQQQPQQSRLPGCSRAGIAQVLVQAQAQAQLSSDTPAPSPDVAVALAPSLDVAVALAPAALLAALRALEGAAAHTAGAGPATAAVALCAEDFALWLRIAVAAPLTATAVAATTATAGSHLAAPLALRYCRARLPLQGCAAVPDGHGAAATASTTAATAALMHLHSSVSSDELAAMLPGAPAASAAQPEALASGALALNLEVWHNPSGLLCGSLAVPLETRCRQPSLQQHLQLSLQQPLQSPQPEVAAAVTALKAGAAVSSATVATEAAADVEAEGMGSGLCRARVAGRQNAPAEAMCLCSASRQFVPCSGGCDGDGDGGGDGDGAGAAHRSGSCCLSPAA